MRIVPVLCLALCACATTTKSTSTSMTSIDFDAIVAAPDRLPADRALDAGRKPAEFLRELDLAPGMHVVELGAALGYTAELISRAVGDAGHVYAHNSQFILERFAEKPLAERLARPVVKNVTRLDRPFDDPFPAELHGTLDRVVLNAFYHDTVWMKTDRARMNRAVFDALKPGGRYIVADSSAKPGTGAADAETLHRIDEALVKQEVLAAGFAFLRESSLLRNPADTRDWNASPRAAGDKRGTSDRFLFVFEKPAK